MREYRGTKWLSLVLLFLVSEMAWTQGTVGVESADLNPTTQNSTAIESVLASRAEHGQIWREYDLTAYTNRVVAFTGVPQFGVSQSGTDEALSQTSQDSATAAVTSLTQWILHETGPEIWCGEAVSVLSATPEQLRIYHTPQVQAIVEEVVDRFTNVESATYGCRVKLFSLHNAKWRTTLRSELEIVPVQNTGVTAWLMDTARREAFDAAIAKQSGYRVYYAKDDTGYLVTASGIPLQIRSVRSREYVQDANATSAFPGYTLTNGSITEGFTAKLIPLLSTDLQSMDVAIDYELAIPEQIQNVGVNFVSPAGQKQQVEIEVPHMYRVRGAERFRWPVGQTLLLSLGFMPPPESPPASTSAIPLPSLPGKSNLVELLLELDCVTLRTETQ